MGIPQSISNELEAAEQRTGLTPQLVRAADVLRTLFSFEPVEVECLFRVQGQADEIAAAGVRDIPDEYTVNQ